MLACNCLNVIIESETNDFQKVTLDPFNLTEDETRDCFFKQELLQVGKLGKITKSHSDFVNIRTVGPWLIHNCLNCDVHTHAIHKDRGAALVLVARKLLTTGSITALRNSDQYSSTFNIIINYNPLDDDKGYDYLPADIERTIANLKQRANEIINKEVAAVEERVRLFTEQQFAALEEFRDKAHKEHKALTRVIISKRLKSARMNETSTNVNMSSPEHKSRLHSIENVPEESLNGKSAITKPKHIVVADESESPRSTNPRHNAIRHTSSFDAEGLFQLEDMDDSRYSQSDTDDTDNEESYKDEGGIPINSKQMSKALSMAKSLPMNIPTFMSSMHNHASDDSDDLLSRPEDPLDIAASIKALAKSVHGDTVFGDLPRPRFSTHI